MLLTDPGWAALLAVVSVGYYVLTIAVSTSYFTDNGGPSVSRAAFWGTIAVFTAQAVPIAWRTRHPVLTFGAVYLAFLAAVAVAVDRNFTITPTFLFAVFTLAAHTSRRTWVPVLALAAGTDLALHLALAWFVGGRLDPLVVLAVATRVLPTYVAPLLAGLLYGSQRRSTQLAVDRATALRSAAEAQAAAAVVAERNRMARELHDVAAHHLTGILLQTKAAAHVRATDPDAVAEVLAGIRAESELTMRSLREVVGVLRADESTDPSAAPALSSLPELVASLRALHPWLDLTVDGDLDDLSPAVSLACYRIIQESVTNARKHAPGAQVRIRVRRAARDLVVDVLNEPAGPGDQPDPARDDRRGYGLVGMRERATMLGGTLSSGSTPDGGWRNRAVLPLAGRVPA
jgi:signal transduction histidine kinase